MVNIRRASSCDQQTWDDYVNQHNHHSPYHLFCWQQAVTEAYHHSGYYLIAEKITNNKSKIVGVLPLIVFKKPLSKPSLCALPFCDVGGVLADDSSIAELLISESKIIGKSLQAKFIEIRSTKVSQSQLEKEKTPENKASSENNGKVSMLMSLPEDSELLFASFKSKLRSQIRKAEKNGLHYKIGSDKTMLDDFYQVFSHNMKALGSPVHAKQWFESLLEYYQEKMVISIVYKNEIPIGGGIVLIAANKAAIPWASTKAEFNRLSPNMMLYWSLLKHLSDNGITEFDFGRSSYGEGTFKFKQQWGALPAPLDWHTLQLCTDHSNVNTEKAANNTSSGKLREIIESIWRKLPLKVTILLGPKIRKYISL